MNFTKGPWEVCVVDGGWDGVKPRDFSTPICKLVENNPANARLIAEAPEMFRQLVDLTNWLEDQKREDCDAYRDAMALISRVNGGKP